MATTSFGNKAHTVTAPGQANRAWASQFPAPVTGTITQLLVWTQSGGGGTLKAKAFVCADSSNTPAAVQSISAGFTPTNGAFSGPVMAQSIVSGVKSWLGIVNKTGYPSWGLGYNAAFLMARKDTFNYTTPPSSMSPADSIDGGQAIAIYAVVTYGSSSVVVNLSGQAVASSVGSLKLGRKSSIAGNNASSAAGSVRGRTSAAASGLASVGSQGILMPAAKKLLAGASVIAVPGAVKPSSLRLVPGVVTTTNVGAIQPTKLLTLLGVYANGGQGSVRAAAKRTIAGNSAASAIGSVRPAVTKVLGTVSAASSIGTFRVASVAHAIGLQATSALGVLAPPGNVTVALDGVSAGSIAGLLTPALRARAAGVAALGAAGAFAPALHASLAGKAAAAAAGLFRVAAMPQLQAVASEGAVGDFVFVAPRPRLVSISVENVGSACSLTVSRAGIRGSIEVVSPDELD